MTTSNTGESSALSVLKQKLNNPTELPDTSSVLTDLAGSVNVDPVDPEPEPEPEPVEVPEIIWYQYHSARVSTRTITDTGIRIAFASHEYFTREPAVVAWLDNQIAINGLPGITKGGKMTSAERDPMEVLKRKHIAEYIEEENKKKAAAAMGQLRNMGSTQSVGSGSSINPATSKHVPSG